MHCQIEILSTWWKFSPFNRPDIINLSVLHAVLMCYTAKFHEAETVRSLTGSLGRNRTTHGEEVSCPQK